MKETFIIRTEWLAAIQELKPVDQLTVYNNLFAFHKGETIHLPNLSVKLVWKLIEPTLKGNIEKYDKRKETSAHNGVLGGRPKKQVEETPIFPDEELQKIEEDEQQQAVTVGENLNNLKKPTGLVEKKPNKPTLKPNNLKNPDSVFVSVSVSDNDNESKSHSGGSPPVDDKVQFWSRLVSAWFDFYGQRFKNEKNEAIKPVFKKSHAGNLKQIITTLKKISIDAGREWNAEYAEYTLRGFFQKAYLHDDWLKKNFELGNMISRFNAIKNGNSNQQNGKPGNIKNHGKSAGAIAIAHSLAADLGIADD